MQREAPPIAESGVPLLIQAGLEGPATSIVISDPIRHVKEHCGTPLRSVSSFAFGVLDVPVVAAKRLRLLYQETRDTVEYPVV